MTVNVKYNINGDKNNAATFKTIQVTGTQGALVMIDNPDTLNGSPVLAGYKPEVSQMPLIWEKNAVKEVTFNYVEIPPVNPLTAAKAAAQGVTELAAQDPALADQAAVIAAIQSAVVAAVNNGNVTVQVAANGTPAYTPVVNGTNADHDGTDGTLTVDITLSADGFDDVTITGQVITAKAKPYVQTPADIANGKIAAAKAALTKTAIEAKLTTAQDASLTETAAVALVQTAATGVLTDTGTTVAGVSVAVVAKTGGTYTAPSAGNTAGSVEVTLTITLDPGTAETFDLTISIPSSVT